MKLTVKKLTEITITHIEITVPVRYGEEDIPKDFPLRQGDVWNARVNIDTGIIDGWPQGKTGRLHMKVCDEGHYVLYSYFGDYWDRIASLDDYVPHGVVPGEYGDYICLDIDAHGAIRNWPKHPDVSRFFGEDL